MDKKGQGALEYLLLIGGAVLVAVIVIGLVITLGGTAGSGTTGSVTAQLCKAQDLSNGGSCYTCQAVEDSSGSKLCVAKNASGTTIATCPGTGYTSCAAS